MSEWSGGDPNLRRLRSLAVVVILGLIAFVVVDGQANDPATVGSLVGALLVALGFEVGLRWPGSKND